MGWAAAEGEGELLAKEGCSSRAGKGRGKESDQLGLEGCSRAVPVREELVELACMKQEWGKLLGRVKRGEE